MTCNLATRPTGPAQTSGGTVIKRIGRKLRTVTADRGCGEAAVEDDLHEHSPRRDPPQRQTQQGPARRRTRTSVSAEP
jgi:hypothetical protein